ncbi:class I SAM-dependent methyltransferase [Halomarina oriensis]|uniref:Methyltransferase domain-containing protein n=1 Tax=Halomarina oriensis TaxID=671145 RepID=A0A6B0GHK5_9EURY|nr:class I SAM-dependent methyltransferase [Halomarina oriensis]MWG33271.1 methyltransferase domain-containing protein [Halomarina oriensis]
MGQRRRVRDAYDDIAADYDADRGTAGADVLRTLLDRLDPDSRVLDAGCGGGRVALEGLAERHRAVGLDFSREQLRLAAEAGRGDEHVAGDMTHLPFADDSFDALTSLFAVIHVPTEEHATVFSEFARVVRPDGWMLFNTGDQAWTGANDDWLETGTRMEWSYPAPAVTRELVTDAGFVVESVWSPEDEHGGPFPMLLARNEG